MSDTHVTPADFDRALKVGRPPNVTKLFPNSRALIVSGKYVDRAMLAKGKAIETDLLYGARCKPLKRQMPL